MTLIRFDTIDCPYCNKENEIRLYSTVNVDIDPDLRRKILDDSLNTFVCRECLFKCKLNFDFLYHDMKNRFILYFSEDQERINEQITFYENFDFKGFNNDGLLNYFRMLVGVKNWEELKETIKDNERYSKMMKFDKESLDNLFKKNSIEFYNYVSRKKSLRKHSELKYFIDNIIKISGLEKQTEEKINKIKNEIILEISDSDIIKIKSKAETERLTSVIDNNDMTVKNSVIIPPDKNEFGIELIDIKSLNFINYYRKFTELEIYEFCKYRVLGISNYVVGQCPEKSKEVLCNIEYPDSTNFNEGNVRLSQSIFDKWDIKVGEDKIHFLNSHTGEYIFAASILRGIKDGRIILSHIEMNSGNIFYEPQFAISIVDFLIKAYIMKVKTPFPIPKNLKKDLKNIIYYACDYFMEKAEFGSYENTLTEFFNKEPQIIKS